MLKTALRLIISLGAGVRTGVRTSSFRPNWAKLNILENRNEMVAITDVLISKDVWQVCGVCLPLRSWGNGWVHFGLRQTFVIQSLSNVIQAQTQWLGPGPKGPGPKWAPGPNEIMPWAQMRSGPRPSNPGPKQLTGFCIEIPLLIYFTPP